VIELKNQQYGERFEPVRTPVGRKTESREEISSKAAVATAAFSFCRSRAVREIGVNNAEREADQRDTIAPIC
jgi:hypothetical protein